MNGYRDSNEVDEPVLAPAWLDAIPSPLKNGVGRRCRGGEHDMRSQQRLLKSRYTDRSPCGRFTEHFIRSG